MQIVHILSIIIEAVVAAVGVKLILQKKIYGWGILVTFGIYVFYDIARYLSLAISQDVLYFSFFIASVSAFWVVWSLVKKKK